VRAPFSGTVVSAGINPGDQVTATTAAFSVLDPNLVRIDATVDEANVIRLRQGMAVAVTFDALQGRSFQGAVASVTPAGVTQQGVVTFPVTVVFNSQGYTIPPGTTANLRVITESHRDVLSVPSRAIVRQGRQSFVQVLVDGKPDLKPVQTGITGDNFTEILEGVEEGEVIVIAAGQQTAGQQGAFGTGGLPGLGAGGPAPAQPARR
jgi:RND family efflux transporter MFP subunit